MFLLIREFFSDIMIEDLIDDPRNFLKDPIGSSLRERE